ncbi:anti-restriction protein [Pantoea phage vB_PagM_SSEM1]|uniref:Putative antirestriction protein n=1 Tax=Pantoea phage vB_PagM_SSEM1 TaxID=2721760 RepID=A0A6H0D9D5_9CAUD|nr:anti-restriction protein [Pantoea phage vB_PagM_SSEM1]QIS79316.1 putative antirestriction protein [Pantoea phage vB_PagM_SSEM1]
MDSFSITRKIETVNHVRDICVRFYGLKSGTDIWLDAEEFISYGRNMAEFLELYCELDKEVAKQIADADYEVVAAEGICEICLIQPKGFDWEKYAEISNLRDSLDDEVIIAVVELEIPFDKIEDSYLGKYDSFLDFVTESFDEHNLPEIPERYHNYIDYEKIAADWDAGGGYANFNGYIFTS